MLVELKQHRQVPFTLASHRLPWGDLEFVSLHDGLFRLDGGGVFGAVARSVWEAQALPDDRHRVLLGMRPLVVEADWGRMIIDCGVGDKMSVEQRDLYALDRTRHLDHALAGAALSAEALDLVLATHLHFDHVGGATIREHDALKPRFPRARYLIRAAEWEETTHPHERSRASYFPDDFLPLTTTAHIRDAWIMGYDLFPMETLAFKRRFLREAIDREYLVFFVHDPLVSAGYIREAQGRAGDTWNKYCRIKDFASRIAYPKGIHGKGSHRHHRRQRSVRHG